MRILPKDKLLLKEIRLKKEAHNQIRSVENIIVIEQDNLYVTVTSFYNGGGGAIAKIGFC
jgi:hypothetical protein